MSSVVVPSMSVRPGEIVVPSAGLVTSADGSVVSVDSAVMSVCGFSAACAVLPALSVAMSRMRKVPVGRSTLGRVQVSSPLRVASWKIEPGVKAVPSQ